MGMDARVRYTKRVIQDSVIALVQENPFHKITLTEVCRLAEINRTTFYKYYTDIYDWKEQLERECLSRTSDVVLSADAPTSVNEILTRQFQDMKDNAQLYGLISSPNFESGVLDMCLSMCLEKADADTTLFEGYETDSRRRWNCHYVVYGMRGVITCWLKDGMKEEPKVLASYCTEWMYKLLTSTEKTITEA